MFTFDDIKKQINPELSRADSIGLLNVLNESRDCFATKFTEVGKTNVTKMRTELTDDLPITYRPYRMTLSEREVSRKIVQELKDNEIVGDSTSQYSSPILLVKKEKWGTAHVH